MPKVSLLVRKYMLQ